tara:strand:+ start:366 stop:713 length:348 start_codon:yes stop_codon:yes gene_type:complete
MKKKKSVHPKLFISIDIEKLLIFFKQNTFNNDGSRLIENEPLKNNIKYNDIDLLLLNKNKEQFAILEKYIKIQKKVLDKYEKSRNYDAYTIVKYSISQMNKFKEDFESWFKNNTL